ncbi:MAG: UDP-N-acetylmuramate--L-alanine ligase [Bacteroidetes bacterium]|nr:UDP-N-acetylmuramate--L-alanine ligase [Bacteroidota bacterium]HET6245586.1 UDP-N-acetylmuramate--L-alanine ligase [Bacteroidia bacterium]
MNLNNFHNVYFIGIGGIGMSALARYFHALGKNVSGYDKTSTKLTDSLALEGIAINFEDSMEVVLHQIVNSDIDKVLVVYTPAVPKGHKQLNYFTDKGFTVKKRSEVLGEITRGSFTIAVAGTHGKTTTSCLLAHIFKHSGKDCCAFMGGISVNYNSNIILPTVPGKETITIVEADEYDRSFLTLHPDIAIITSMDADHLDIYGEARFLEESFNLFAAQIKPNGNIIYRKQLPLIPPGNASVETYSVNSEADYYADNIRMENESFSFDFISSAASIKNISFNMPGRHNIENAVAASAAAILAGIEPQQVKIALESFRGVKRRFEYIVKSEEFVFIDDYAHHPEELKACIAAVKELYPNKRITGVFQPHLFSRTNDFADAFAESLDLLDDCILLDIYPARELPLAGVSSQMLLDRMKIQEKKLVQKQDLVTELKKRKPQVLLTLGAGDIDKLVEIIGRQLQE